VRRLVSESRGDWPFTDRIPSRRRDNSLKLTIPARLWHDDGICGGSGPRLLGFSTLARSSSASGVCWVLEKRMTICSRTCIPMSTTAPNICIHMHTCAAASTYTQTISTGGKAHPSGSRADRMKEHSELASSTDSRAVRDRATGSEREFQVRFSVCVPRNLWRRNHYRMAIITSAIGLPMTSDGGSPWGFKSRPSHRCGSSESRLWMFLHIRSGSLTAYSGRVQ